MKKLKVIMIDGFKPEYLKYAPYLSSLTKFLQWGKLEMPMGHWRGVQVLFEGYSDIISVFYKSDNSSLKFVKRLRWLENFGESGRFIVDSLINLNRLIQRKELFRTGKIPLDILDEFEISINRHFSKKPGIKFYCFGDLDSLAHKHGTKSPEIIKAIKRIDKKISKMKFDFIFSDHGMCDIQKIISVPEARKCFIDGDMARYWGDKKELEQIKSRLPLKFGKIIKWDEKYGELIFLVDSGVLIYPNFWDKKGPAKAMHGYDGKSEDMKAVYILNKKGNKKDLDAYQLHKILKNQFNEVL
ncbi:MAG: alkaline phosphatase family protein [Nanoarchaeota archaeon]